MSLQEWRDGEITQAAVAWVLGCVFVRFLEDNALIDQALISGPGDRRVAALGHREEHFRAHPEHSDREYLEACFRSVAAFPSVAPLYHERHNPLWRLAPTSDGARTLRETFTSINPATGALAHDFTDPDLGTRFLGDLYQDLSEAAKKHYALLQTPDFIEEFILDNTLTPALEEFGLDEVRLIDPTCGSGHFLIGAFERLYALWIESEPGSSRMVLAQRALDHIAGVDLNPYAIAIARFRLMVNALRACGITRLAEAPAFSLHLAIGDSLLHGPLPIDGAQMLFDANRLNKNIAHVYETEDEGELKEILGRGYQAVVGNPPYIAGSDGAVREAYRKRYATCYKEFALTAPFMERFFELAVVDMGGGRPAAGFVGKITGNAFLKREFGVPLVDRFLRAQDVTELIDTSGVHLPGHGTPTLILLGRARLAQTATLKVVEGLRAEPTRPEDPAEGIVWRAIAEHHSDENFEDSTIRVGSLPRATVFVHPVSLGPGRELREVLDSLDLQTVSDIAEDVGYTGQTNADDLFVRPFRSWPRLGIHESWIKRFVTGTDVRHWAIRTDKAAWFPYDDAGLMSELGRSEQRALWPWREVAFARRTFNKQSYKEEGRAFFEWHQVSLRRHVSSHFLVWPFVQTHTHFVPVTDRASVFNRHAPFIKFTDEWQTHAAAGFLNSSVACAWLKQVCYDRGGGGIGGGIAEEEWERFYEFAVGRVASAPLVLHEALAKFSRRISSLARERADLKCEGTSRDTGHVDLLEERRAIGALESQMIALQEELDWLALAIVGLLPGDDHEEWFTTEPPAVSFGQRAFEIRSLNRGASLYEWFRRHGAVADGESTRCWPGPYEDLVRRRLTVIDDDRIVRFVEQPEHKRRWNWPSMADDERDRWTMMVVDALDDADLWSDFRPRSVAELTDVLRARPDLIEALEHLAEGRDVDVAATLRQLVLDAAVPHLAAQRLTEKALPKRHVWEQVWELQRAEDRGEDVGSIPLPPKYVPADLRSPVYWKHRGKLDVPNEPFVLIPNAERGADASPVVGWAGWDERDLARALAGRVMELREHEAADVDRLTPLLAGVLELIPWIHQWQPESDPLYGGPPGQYFESWLDGQLAELSITRDNLRAWRPPAPTRRRTAKAGGA